MVWANALWTCRVVVKTEARFVGLKTRERIEEPEIIFMKLGWKEKTAFRGRGGIQGWILVVLFVNWKDK